jgi:hypothetical protein
MTKGSWDPPRGDVDDVTRQMGKQDIDALMGDLLR